MLCSLHIFTDVDECENPNTCGNRQQCFNTAGSYFCECILGYENDPQSPLNCIGKHDMCVHAVLLYVEYKI